MQKMRAVIIGASHAAAQLSVSLRQEGWEGEIIMIGDEPHLPYHRPPLSKTFLSGDKTIQDLLIRPASFYEKQKIQFIHGHVVSIDRERKILDIREGPQILYDKLAICTGARVRKLDIKGSHLKGIYYVRNAADIEAIRLAIQNAKHAVIIGGGYIGLETAASLRKQGIPVTLLETSPRILQRVTAPQLSEFYAKIHQSHGVNIYNNMTIKHIVGNTQVQGIVCGDGTTLAADIVIVGIGVDPNIELAQSAGIEVNHSIVIDQTCLTSDPDIVAAGDCTTHFSPLYRRQIRLESVPNANEQAKVAAATLAGKSKSYDALPWFWSDQYDIKLQIVGLNQGYDQLVIRGDLDQGDSFCVFYFQQKRLIAADCINRPLEFMLSKKIINDNIQIDPIQFFDESIDLRTLIN